MNKFVGCAPSAREAARIARRIEVNAAALWIQRSDPPWTTRNVAAIYHPRPWRSTGKPTPRRRYSRAHRRGCLKCVYLKDSRRYIGAWLWCADRNINQQDPHGRRA